MISRPHKASLANVGPVENGLCIFVSSPNLRNQLERVWVLEPTPLPVAVKTDRSSKVWTSIYSDWCVPHMFHSTRGKRERQSKSTNQEPGSLGTRIYKVRVVLCISVILQQTFSVLHAYRRIRVNLSTMSFSYSCIFMYPRLVPWQHCKQIHKNCLKT